MRVQVRLYLDGKLRQEESSYVDDVPSLARRHAEEAKKRGAQKWMVEFFFPDAPKGEEYLRIGTDPGKMVLPVEVKLP